MQPWFPNLGDTLLADRVHSHRNTRLSAGHGFLHFCWTFNSISMRNAKGDDVICRCSLRYCASCGEFWM